MRGPRFPKRKSKLTPQGKAIAAAQVLLAVGQGTMDDKQARDFLRDAIGLNWSLVTAVQYLTGQEAIGALEALRAEGVATTCGTAAGGRRSWQQW